MPQTDDAASQHSTEASLKERRPSLTDSDVDTDAFEDAVDAASVRSLTKRSVSATKPQPPSPEQDATKSDAESDSEEEAEEAEDASSVKSEEKPEPPSRGSTPLSHRISNISNTSNLDVVNLDDDAAPQPQEPASPSEQDQLSRTTSLNNSAAPVVPSSPAKSSPPAVTEAKVTAAPAPAPAPAPPAAAPTPAPAPMGRRLTSPFSWLSRNSSKDKDVSAASNTQTSVRRNTASSVATVGSNPEMMLSKLEEEREGDGKATNRNSLKDRFKVLRAQQETGAPLTVNTEDVPAEAVDGEAAVAELPPPSPLPPPSTDLAPGTAAGINIGPSEEAVSQVDWDLWQSVVYEGPAAVARSSAEELNKAIATGIPSAIRGVIWQVLAQSKNEDLEGVYRDLVARGTEKDNRNRHSSSTAASSFSNANLSVQSGDGVASSASSVNSELSGGSGLKGDKKDDKKDDKNAEAIAKAQAAAAAERMRKDKEDLAALQRLEKVIRRDLGARTSYSKYAAAAGLQEGLFGVCKAYALFDEGVGYAQGMNFLIMPLLFNMPEQEAFCLLVRLMNHYGLRDLFIHDMPGLHRHLYQFERLLEDLEPALYCHLHRRGISPHLYATPWFLTLFAYRFPLQLVLRIYDLILSEGLSAIIRIGIVLMQKNTATLLEISDMQQLTTYLKDKLFDVYIDKEPSQGSLLENGFFGSSSSSIDKEIYRADQLVKDACEVKLTAELLEGYTAEWEEKTKAEKERETELKELRTSNQALTIQVRKLEERVEVCDREQADLATELVHTKVENDELKDEVEALRNQVQELKKVIEEQPFEMEETWKLERDDLMKRNEKVHLENEKVERELAELEEELVQTKLQYAEISGQHEALVRKWSDLKRQFA
ncbi:RabGAP/TBC [Trichoderma novae-zelandiae]